MDKRNIRTIGSLLVFAVIIGGLIFLLTSILNNIAHAAKSQTKFNKEDFTIKDFGIATDGNPFLTVEGKAGGSTPDKEDTGYAYVFVTDNGTFAVSSDWMYTQWHTHELTLDDKNCVQSMNMNGGQGAYVGDDVKVTKTGATKVDKVMTVEFIIDRNSICASKIFDSAP